MEGRGTNGSSCVAKPAAKPAAFEGSTAQPPFFAPKVALSTEFLALKHYSSIFIQSSNLECFSWKSHAVGKTAQSLTYSIMEKPPTRWGDCLNMLLSCFRKIMSAL